jgi:hypothetical protein
VKTLLWTLLFLLGLVGAAVPAVYLHAASKLPQLETEYDLEKLLRNSIEGERMSLLAGTTERSPRPVDFKRPDFTRLPKELVALYIAQLGCPTYFQTPREEGLAWGWRLFAAEAFGAWLAGDGGCEYQLALRIAEALGIPEGMERTAAAHRLHAFLQKDQLIAYDLATLYFDRGVVGVEDAAWSLFQRELNRMQLAELAEVALVLPPHHLYGDVQACRNSALLQQNRDVLLSDLAAYQLVTEERARNAMAQPVACSR